MEWFTAPEYALSRLVLLRLLAAVYLVGFLAAARQFRPLLGARGLLPIPRYLRRAGWREAPSLFQWRYSDRLFAGVAWTGAALAAGLCAGLADAVPLWGSMLLWAVLWALYLSIANVGQTWYSFGWESLLLEAGTLAVFLGNASVAPPWPVLLLVRWLLFRVEFGAGLIKLRGDRCWRDLSCLRYHHETQPMPGPFSWYFHHLPMPLHRVEVAANHLAQLGLPVLLFAPQPVASVAAAGMVATQLWLVASGNFAWLNWLTIALAFGALRLPGGPHPRAGAPLWFEAVVLAFTAVVLVLSRRPAGNLLSRGQLMNYSFDRLHLVNSYGAFGSISRVRFEVVLEGTAEAEPGAGAVWREYGFRGKPGALRRRPRQYAPYHLRLDWLMWFAALSPSYARPWLPALVDRLLAGDPGTLRLLRDNPFPGEPPRQVRAVLYRYRFTTPAERRASGNWWHRERVGLYLAAVGR
ncbi:lipase maturation factor family protein [Kitasatospora sp. NPDC006697]|uniref:lipase maturation factor family protein n=1 Tax=Kitasatospora sp. NPDC006697 TaxID=3364020 RepID=UPI0036C98E0D